MSSNKKAAKLDKKQHQFNNHESEDESDESKNTDKSMDEALVENVKIVHSNVKEPHWRVDDDRELVANIKKQLQGNDEMNYKRRLTQIRWYVVAFKNFSAQDCEKRFNGLLKEVRLHRNLEEIVVDIQSKIKAPLNSYQLFVKDQLSNVKSSTDFEQVMKNLPVLFKNLPVETRALYEQQANDLETTLTTSVNAAAAKTPKASSKSPAPKKPFALFAEHMRSTGVDGSDKESALREMYGKLSRLEKHKWIIEAVKLNPQGGENMANNFLTKEEKRIYLGKAKQPPTAYSLFFSEQVKLKFVDCNPKEKFSRVSELWKQLDEKDRLLYIEAAKLEKQKMEKAQKEFLEKCGSVQKGQKRGPPTAATQQVSHNEIVVDIPDTGVHETIPIKKIKYEVEEGQLENNQVTATLSPSRINNGDVKDEYEDNKIQSDSGLSPAKKSSKKSKPGKRLPSPGPIPPISLLEYFKQHIYTGKSKKAEKAFEKLEKKERKQYKKDYKSLVEDYYTRLETFLDSLSNEEAIAYKAKIEASEAAAKANDDSE